ncbi:MAG: hypothetical protein NC313_02530 [Butyrivibrio sp.]|nr:hypothetical protein [Butyrivibrio sp.]
MKKYSFSLTKREVLEFSIRSMLEQMRLQIVTWLLILLIAVLEISVIHWMGVVFLFFIFAVTISVMLRTYKMSKARFFEKARTVWVENGVLITVSGTSREEMPYGGVHVVKRTKNLLMLGHYQSKKRLAWYAMPLRVFSGRQETDEFVRSIYNPQGAYNVQETDAQRETYNQQMADSQQAACNQQMADSQQAACNQQMADSQQATGSMSGYGVADATLETMGKELLHINFWLEESRWQQVCFDTTEIVQSGIMGKNNKVMALWIIFAINCVLFLYECIAGGSFIIMSCLFLMLVLVTTILNNVSVNPKKRIKKQLKKGILQDSIYGNWDISITETGVEGNNPKEGRIYTSWDRFSWLIECETAFYLFWEDKKHFVMILKEGLGSYERGEELKRICAEKNVTYAVGKRVKYIPEWAYILFNIAIIVMFFYGCIKVGIKDGSSINSGSMGEYGAVTDGYDDITYWQYDEVDVADYPDYVPLEEQVKILRSYNFTLSDEIVETARNSMDEYEHMRIYVEGYPYTWLLTEIGTPDYNDEWEVAGYSDEVFWFDFEGWDISTDYITVLEGMMALAQGSAISSVSNIREDTSAVDWDKGTGSIDVVLEWNGEEYQWTMDMDYDWIDEKVLGILNGLLDKTDEKERFYATGDNGQGAVVFYCDSEWAKDFEKDTGLELSVCK